MIFLITVCAIPLVFTFANSLSMRVVRSRNTETIGDSVSILIPMRNEAENVAGVVNSALATSLIPHMEVIVLDDHSSDQTNALLHEFPGIEVASGIELPEGWLGKNFACHQLVMQSTGDYLVFVDADVRLTELAVASAISHMNNYAWDFISPYPQQIAITSSERLIQPLLQWSWLSSVPLRIAERTKFPSMVIANGQFMIVKRAAYLTSGGHKEIRLEILDDLELARLLVKNGFKGGVAIGSDVASCRMYNNRIELFAGYTKSLWRAFGSLFGSIATSIFLFVTGVLPILLALSGYSMAWIGYFLVILSRYISALRTRSISAASTALLHPLSILILIYLISNSWYRKSQGTLMWRGRTLV